METQTIKTKASGKRYNEQFKKDTVDYWVKNKKAEKGIAMTMLLQSLFLGV